MTEPVWVLADPRAGTAAQALGIAERLGVPFRVVPLAWSRLARLPLPWPSRAGLAAGSRAALGSEPGPRLVLAAGRRSAPAALWLGRRGARTVQCMRPPFGAARFDVLVVGEHDSPAPADNLLPILGAVHRISPARLVAARQEWASLATLPSPRIAVLLGGRVRGHGLDAGWAAALMRRAADSAGSMLVTTSRRTGEPAGAAVAAALGGTPHRLYRWGEPGLNPYAGFLAWADVIVVTGDSVSMLSEALATAVPVFVADPGSGPRHRRLQASLYAAGQARPIEAFPAPFGRSPLDEAGRVAAQLTARGLLPG
jgi:hypothetical protein